MLLRDNTLQYLNIFLASGIIKIELKKCVVHEIGRMRLHLRPQETQPKWVVCLMWGEDHISEGWGGDGLGNVSEEEFFSPSSRARIYLNCSICFFCVTRLARLRWLLFPIQWKNNDMKPFGIVALPAPCAQETLLTSPSDVQRCGWILPREPCKSSYLHPKLDLKHKHKLC